MTYWVIEASGPQYWIGKKRDSEGFTDKITDAVRFANHQSAEIVRCWLLVDDVRRLTKSVEHMDTDR